jgi:hypothetical protein
MKQTRLLLPILFLALLAGAAGLFAQRAAAQAPDLNQRLYIPLTNGGSNLLCRFGMTTTVRAGGFADPDNLRKTRASAVIDWHTESQLPLSPDLDYIHVLHTGGGFSQASLNNIPSLVKKYPAAYWQIGNEPDTCYEEQDCTLPEDYAAQYLAYARALRAADPQAKIGFGAIVQPTPIRLVYLDKVWAKLTTLAGSAQAASDLIDYWTIHSFMLNEKPGEWGTGVPPGVDPSEAPLFTIKIGAPRDETYKTYSNAIFEERVRTFRTWMAAKGQRNKPLWITEYGSLLPPIDPPNRNLVNVPDKKTIDFMIKSFNFLRSATDSAAGLPTDGNRLVQRWFWYSLNEHRYTFGGTLFDPENNNLPTPVGEAFIDYIQTLPADPCP